MKSPFPGMDPFIEECGLWVDFHTELIGAIERKLAVDLPERYFIQTGERTYVVLAGPDGKQDMPFYPDVAVESPTRGRAVPASRVAVAEPAAIAPARGDRRLDVLTFCQSLLYDLEVVPVMTGQDECESSHADGAFVCDSVPVPIVAGEIFEECNVGVSDQLKFVDQATQRTLNEHSRLGEEVFVEPG